MHRRTLPLAALLVAALLVAALLPALPAAASAPRAAHPTPDAARPSWVPGHGLHPAGVSAAARAAAVRDGAAPASRINGLDPSATGLKPAPNGTVKVAVTGSAGAVAQQVRAAGGRVLVSADGTSVAVVPQRALAGLASARGITGVDAVNQPYAQDTSPGPSQAVAASGADVWHTGGITGSGVQLAIIDLGFGVSQAEYDGEVTAGHLGAGTTVVNEDCTDENNASTPYDGEPHGLAVAEVVQQQAPDAQLFLYCVGSESGAASAEADIESRGIKIISSSVGWFGESRGDGTGVTGSVAATARRARQHGILWINSAGNEVPQHYSGPLADLDKDGYLDLGNHSETTYPYESNFYYTAPGSGSAPSEIAFLFQWDNWPTTTHRVTLQAYGVQCHAPDGTPPRTSADLDGCWGRWINPDADGNPTPISKTNASGSKPYVALNTSSYPNTSPYGQVWELLVKFDGSFTTGAHYDLFGEGNTSYASDLSCPTSDSSGNCIFSSAAKATSVTSPANSPDVLGVGAADVGADGTSQGTLEYFSSQGPTIDKRIKPDLTGWDGLSSYVPEYSGGFYGTSAAAPSVAGAAALVAQANPDFDAAQLQDFLQRRARNGAPYNPPLNTFGHGVLTLGATSGVTAPAGSGYTAITPKRILDTRTTLGGHHAPLGTGGTATVTVPGLPADATAVAINLTGVGAKGSTYLSVYPGGTSFPGTSNLNLSKTDSTAAVLAVVTVRGGKITVRNSSGAVNALVDEVGYFSAAGTGLYTPLPAAHRVLDTRTSVGGHHSKLAPGRSVIVHPALPADATAAVVNLTTVDMKAGGHISAAPQCSGSTSTLNFGKYTRANMAIVGLDAGQFCIVDATTATDVIVDVVGYIGSTGSTYVALPAAQRIVDTRTGNGGSAGGHASRALAAASATAFYGSNVGIVPATATALFTGMVEASATSGGYLTVFPGTSKPASLTSNLNFSSGRVVPNAAVITLSSHSFGIYNSYGSTQVAVDIFGYFLPAS